jgi:hypothetical protein
VFQALPLSPHLLIEFYASKIPCTEIIGGFLCKHKITNVKIRALKTATEFSKDFFFCFCSTRNVTFIAFETRTKFIWLSNIPSKVTVASAKCFSGPLACFIIAFYIHLLVPIIMEWSIMTVGIKASKRVNLFVAELNINCQQRKGYNVISAQHESLTSVRRVQANLLCQACVYKFFL